MRYFINLMKVLMHFKEKKEELKSKVVRETNEEVMHRGDRYYHETHDEPVYDGFQRVGGWDLGAIRKFAIVVMEGVVENYIEDNFSEEEEKEMLESDEIDGVFELLWGNLNFDVELEEIITEVEEMRDHDDYYSPWKEHWK